jgi:hypothetical protein
MFSRLRHWQRWITAFSEKAFLIPNVAGTSNAAFSYFRVLILLIKLLKTTSSILLGF